MRKRFDVFLAAIASAVATAVVLSPYVSIPIGNTENPPRHMYETSMPIPDWCQIQAEKLVSNDQSVEVEFYPIDDSTIWDSGVKAIALVTGSSDSKFQAQRLIASVCSGRTTTVSTSPEHEAALLKAELARMRSEGIERANIKLTQDGFELQAGTNIGNM